MDETRGRPGLRYGTVELVPHMVEWRELFSVAATELREALASWSCEVEHVGSTAVPGLIAKPILDIAVGVPNEVPFEPVVACVESSGYEYRGDAGAEGGHVLVHECAPLERTHHVHVVRLQGEQWNAYLTFRDLLRGSSTARQAYVRAKESLAARHAQDRRAYSAGKGEVVRRLLAQARME